MGDDEYGPVTSAPGAPSAGDRITQRIAEALNHNGLNTILLDIKMALGTVTATCTHMMSRQDDIVRRLDKADDSRGELHKKANALETRAAAIEKIIQDWSDEIVPLVKKHETLNIEREGARKKINEWLGWAKWIWGAVAGAVGAAFGWLLSQLPAWLQYYRWPWAG